MRQYARRGNVYAWLRAYYSQVSATLKTGEQSWPGLVNVMARDGITGRNRGKLTANAALKVWQRVERDVEVEVVRRGEERPKRKYPSRISPDWRPPLVSGALGGTIAQDETKAAPSGNGSVSGRPPSATPIDFVTMDADGKPLEDGKVFYRGQVMSRRAAEEIERVTRGFR